MLRSSSVVIAFALVLLSSHSAFAQAACEGDSYLGDDHIRGFSVRTYDAETGKWHLVLNWPQPDRAGFGTLEGEFRHGRGDFVSESTNADGATQLTRYSFTDIGHQTFRWNNGTSVDGGSSWSTNWIMEFARREQWTMIHLDGGNGFDWFHGQTEEGSIVLADESGAERIRMVPGDGNTMTRVLGGNPITFVRR